MDEGLNIQEYINSGVLELYISGTLPEKEAREVASLAEKHPEIQEAISRVEQTMMQYFEAYAGEEPSVTILEGALAMMDEQEEDETPVVPFSPPPDASERSDSSSNGWKWLAIAAVLALLFSIGFNLLIYNRWQNLENRFTSLLAERNQLAEDNQTMQTRMEDDQRLLAHLSSFSSKSIDLNGVPLSPESKASVVWNPETQEVLLAAHALPKPEEGFQYQLWAIVDGVPVDAGVFAYNDPNQFLKLVSGQPAAFAITLEKEGGSPTPTLEKMYVYGDAV